MLIRCLEVELVLPSSIAVQVQSLFREKCLTVSYSFLADSTVDPGEILQRLKMLRGERAKGLDNYHEVDNTSPWHVSGLRTKSPGQSSALRHKDDIDRRNLFTPSKESSWGIAEELQGLLSTNPLSKMLLIPDQHADQSFDIGDRFLQGVNWLRTPNSSSSANTLKPHSNRSRNSILHSPRDVIEQSRELRRSIGSHYNVPQSPRIAIPKSPRIDLLQSFRNSDRTSLNTIPQSPRTTVPQSPRIDLLHSFRNSGRTSLKKNSPSPITTIPQSPRISVRFSQDSETRPLNVGSFGADPMNPDPMQTPKSPGRSFTQLLQHLGVNPAQQASQMPESVCVPMSHTHSCLSDTSECEELE